MKEAWSLNILFSKVSQSNLHIFLHAFSFDVIHLLATSCQPLNLRKYEHKENDHINALKNKYCISSTQCFP